MFSGLRIRLTLLYLAVALALIALFGGGTYLLLTRYFERTTDLALQYRLAQELRLRGIALPDELASAELAWYDARPLQRPSRVKDGQRHDDHHGSAGGDDDHEQIGDDSFDAELAPIFVLALNR
ncbi:MAG TPA: hypothetical protein VFT66_21315, partial [Roseiflexaceae bacterium]|nr:hypothetical protein [Roseiflexaceae bacterium]